MSISRRDFLRLAGLISASAALAACAPERLFEGAVQPAPPVNRVHLLALNRLTLAPARQTWPGPLKLAWRGGWKSSSPQTPWTILPVISACAIWKPLA
ncbi:MAG: twin-arginine translocation signal domain-containing protein [Holophaga sp.]|nr:twin-arginine translocation signal domain-containing protein [Holophaga sp.]